MKVPDRMRRLAGLPPLTEYGDDPRDWAGSLHDVRRELPRGGRAAAAITALDEWRSKRSR